jgi:hypothetical protein
VIRTNPSATKFGEPASTSFASRFGKHLWALSIAVSVAVLVYLVIATWFDSQQFAVLAADDLRAFVAAKEGFATLNGGTIGIYKFRPVSVFALVNVASWTECDYRSIARVGLLIHTANTLALFLLLRRLVGVDLLVAVGLSAIGALNRFASYLFMQEQAIFEGLGVLTFLALVANGLRVVEQPKWMTAGVLGLLLLIIIHIHERYLVLLAPLALLAVLAYSRNRAAAIVLGVSAFAAVGVNLAIKKLVLQTPVLIGTTTQPIELNIRQISRFLRDGALNLLGINRGETSLSLQDFSESPNWVQALSVASAMLTVALLATAFARSRNDSRRRTAQTQILLLCVMIAVLLLSASITFRQEYRWLYPAYVAAIVLLGVILKAAGPAVLWPRVVLAALIFVSMVREVWLARFHRNFYAFEAYEIVNNLHATLRRADGLEKIETVSVRGEVAYSDWYFVGDTFSRFYGLPRLRFEPDNPAADAGIQSAAVLQYTPELRSFTLLQAAPPAVLAPPH